MSARIVDLEGVMNFRDYGDYATAAGARIRPGRLYRSAHHGRATEADLETIRRLAIAVVVDLRRPQERLHEPSRRPAGFTGQVIATDLGADEAGDPWWDFVRDSDLSEDAFRDYLVMYYRQAPFDARHLDAFARYFAALGETDGPVLIHCAAGKDRTGILAALTHYLIGVHTDDILADYLLTNTAIGMDQRIPLMLQAVHETIGRTPSEAAARVAMGVEAAYLDGALEAIKAKYGALDRYLTDALGVDAALKARVEAQLLG
jgi:protein tyrosine/serine phosphatase